MQFGLDARVFGNAKIAAIGDATAAAVREQLCLQRRRSARSVRRRSPGRCAGTARRSRRAEVPPAPRRHRPPVLRERLEAGGARRCTTSPSTKRTRRSRSRRTCSTRSTRSRSRGSRSPAAAPRRTSSRCSAPTTAKLAGVKLASIGPITTATLRELGLTPTVEAKHVQHRRPGRGDRRRCVRGCGRARRLMQKWLARLAFSFLILAAVLAWSGRQAARRGDAADRLLRRRRAARRGRHHRPARASPAS